MTKQHKTEASFREFISKRKMSDGALYVVAVSGGIDSMVLMHLCAANHIRALVAHCNFALRGKESDKDEAFIKKEAAKLRLKIVSKRFDTRDYAANQKLSIQEAARKLRYQWFHELKEAYNAEAILTAHQADDAIETYFINMLRGAGLKGLSGIMEDRDSVYRPLIGVSRKDLHSYAILKGILWREDSSNQEDKYLRNKIRHKVLPVLSELRAGLTDRLSENITILRSSSELISSILPGMMKEIATKKGDLVSIDWEKLQNMRGKEVVLFHILNNYGFTGKQSLALCSQPELKTGSSYLSGSHEAFGSRGKLIIKPVMADDHQTILIRTSKEAKKAGLDMKLFPYNSIQKLKVGRSEALFDKDLIKFPMTVRCWQKGDKFLPFGMKGKKSISDFLTDIKTESSEKRKVKVLLSGSDIIWVIGLRADERFKISQKTTKVLQVRLVED